MGSDRVWVDCDPALGVPLADVDDAIALWWLHRRGVAFAGLSSVFGNASLRRTDRVLRAIGDRVGAAVFTGARGRGDVRTEAARALAAFDGTVIALGPLTNVAAALAHGARFRRLVVLGGTDRRLPNLRPLHTTELNFALDPDAAADVLARSRLPSDEPLVEVIPMEPCRTVWFDASDLAGAPDWLARGCRSWLWSSPLRTGRLAFHPWDLLAAAWVLEPGIFGSRRAGIAPDRSPVRRGHVSYVPGSGRVVTSVDAAALRDLWRQALHRG